MSPQQTNEQFDDVIKSCKTIFLQKAKDYGTSWRVLRPISIADQIMIKALRIRNLQQIGRQKIEDSSLDEFRGIINYGIMALIQEQLPADEKWDLPLQEAEAWYDKRVDEVRELMENKNHDYGEAWRQMSQESFVDLILSKLLRIRQIISNDGKTMISEGIASNMMDIINYATFALILSGQNKQSELS